MNRIINISAKTHKKTAKSMLRCLTSRPLTKKLIYMKKHNRKYSFSDFKNYLKDHDYSIEKVNGRRIYLICNQHIYRPKVLPSIAKSQSPYTINFYSNSEAGIITNFRAFKHVAFLYGETITCKLVKKLKAIKFMKLLDFTDSSSLQAAFRNATLINYYMVRWADNFSKN